MTLWYFAHPYTGDEEQNFILANSRTQILMDMGYNILSPITYTHPLHTHKERDYDFWMELCLVLMKHCDGIIFAPGWKWSNGCNLEYEQSTGKQILFYKDIVREGK